jgi:hypothetical protein
MNEQTDMTVAEFLTLYGACSEGAQWAKDNNIQTNQEAWEKLPAEWLIWTATRPGVLTDRELRLFAVWSVRQVRHLMKDSRSIAALDVAERHANGQATDEELAAAWAAARDAARAAARAAAWDAARAAAWAAAGAAAGAAARAAARAAAWDAARAAQTAYLRANTTPCFKRVTR